VSASSSRAASRAAIALILLLPFAGTSKADDFFALDEKANAAAIEAYPAALRAPPFELPDLEGGTRTNADFKGKVVLLSFWATWCAPCVVELPQIEALKAELQDQDFEVVGIAVADRPEAIRWVLGDRKAPFPILLDRDRKVLGQYRATGVPVAYLLSRDGRSLAGKSGQHRWDDPRSVALIRHLLADRGF
jgi:peroxiredoxin